jgi:hypothetical protein
MFLCSSTTGIPSLVGMIKLGRRRSDKEEEEEEEEEEKWRK